MSLVNDMLRDLEQRSGRVSEPLAGVQAVERTRAAPGSRPVATAALVVLVAAAAMFGFIHRTPVAALPETTVVVTNPQPATPPPAPQPIATLASLQRYRFDYRLANTPAPRPASAAQPAAAPVAAPAKRSDDTTPVVVERSEAGRGDTAGTSEQTGRTRVVRTRIDPGRKLRRDGLSALQRGRPAQAEAEFRELIALAPTQTEPYLLLHDALVAQSRDAQARAELLAALEVTAQPARIALVLAHGLVNAGDSPAAQVLLERYRDAPGAGLEYAALLAAVHERNGDYEQAADGYLFLVSQRPGRGAWWIGLAIASEALGRRDEARQAFERASHSRGLDPALARYARERLGQLDPIP